MNVTIVFNGLRKYSEELINNVTTRTPSHQNYIVNQITYIRTKTKQIYEFKIIE